VEVIGKLPDLARAIKEGHYAQKQLFNKGLISYGHRMRFQVALDLAKQFAGQRLLDYGCGDGTLLAMLASGPSAPSESVGVEIEQDLVDDCANRLGGETGIKFLMMDNLHQAKRFDGVFCMEVLEHVVEREVILEQLRNLLAPKGKLIISVPVETGLPLFVKQAARRVAGWRGQGDYSWNARYTPGEYWASSFPGDRQHIVRPLHTNKSGIKHHDHKGFNWKLLRKDLEKRFQIEKIFSSPITWLPPDLGSQAWFVLSHK
jgi:2-polyprenyl-3-methyl-5-hydroxy-6-metoxy-1,4-benzoquinol methylase